MADTKVPKNHFYLDLSLFFFVMAMVMIVIFITPLFVMWYVDFFSGSTRERMQWYEIVLGFIPIVLYIVFVVLMDVFFVKGKDKSTEFHKWGSLLAVCILFIVILIALFFLIMVYLFYFTVAWISALVLFINAAVICLDRMQSNPHDS